MQLGKVQKVRPMRITASLIVAGMLAATLVASERARSLGEISLLSVGGADVHPNDMHGVKIKHPGSQHAVVPNNCKYETGVTDGTYYSLVNHLYQKDIHNLFIKYPQEMQVDCADASIRDEISKLLNQMANYNANHPTGPQMRAWVWERDWFWNDNQGGFNSDGYNDWVNDMSAVINRAKTEGTASVLEGIAPIETNLPGSDRVREYAHKAAQAVNAKTDNWLKNRTLLFPGAGMGSWFKGIGSAGTGFFTNMATQVKYFSFIYKFMQAQDGGVSTNLEPHYYYSDGSSRWADELDDAEPLADRRTYLETTLGFGDLRNFINLARSQGHTWVANTTFWGDSGDGVILMNRGNIQLVHQLIVEELNQTGYFFDYALIGTTEEDAKERTKYVMLDNGTTVTKNTTNAWNDRGTGDTMNVWDEWYRWRLAAPGY